MVLLKGSTTYTKRKGGLSKDKVLSNRDKKSNIKDATDIIRKPRSKTKL